MTLKIGKDVALLLDRMKVCTKGICNLRLVTTFRARRRYEFRDREMRVHAYRESLRDEAMLRETLQYGHVIG